MSNIEKEKIQFVGIYFCMQKLDWLWPRNLVSYKACSCKRPTIYKNLKQKFASFLKIFKVFLYLSIKKLQSNKLINTVLKENKLKEIRSRLEIFSDGSPIWC